MSENIAFIGLGNMGRPMSINLVKKQKLLSVYDLSHEAIKAVAAQGAKGATSVKNAVADADIVITMLPASTHVHDLYLGKGELLNLIKAKTFLIDCSTISPQTSRFVADAAKAKGFEMVDAPVSGGTAGAQAGTLTFIVGGSKENFARAEPLLSLMGKNIFHAGTNGAGQIAKVCNNMLLAIHMIGTSEAINLGVACGIDPKVLSEIMSKSSGRNWSVETYNPYPGVQENVPSSKGYEGGFAVDLMTKDLGLAIESALGSQTATPLGSVALDLYRLHSQKGAGKLDFSSILQFLKKS